jgi:cytochrome b561
VHSIYIVLVLVAFGLICLLFPTELCGGSSLGKYIGVFLAIFWGLRVVLQFVYYDRAVKQENPLGTFCFGAAFLYLAATFVFTAFFGK